MNGYSRSLVCGRRNKREIARDRKNWPSREEDTVVLTRPQSPMDLDSAGESCKSDDREFGLLSRKGTDCVLLNSKLRNTRTFDSLSANPYDIVDK
jgi:hypothetical protein